MRAITRILCATLVLTSWIAPASGKSRHRIALLMGSPWNGEETVIQNDIASLRLALQQRGFESAQIKELAGKLSRRAVLDAVRATSEATATWDTGEVVLYYTGHGSFSGESAQTARPALALGPEQDQTVSWDEIFSTLRLPRGVQFVLLPDC